jgi:hypothetical protein
MADLKVSEAKKRVARELWGDAWVAEMPIGEWYLAQQYKHGLTAFVAGLTLAPAVEEAYAKLKRMERQGDELGRWFEDRGFDTTKEYLDGERFEAEFVKAFGCASTDDAMPPRNAVVLQRLQSGMRPGKTVTWSFFQKKIQNDLGDLHAEGTSKRQLERVVKQLMARHRLS